MVSSSDSETIINLEKKLLNPVVRKNKRELESLLAPNFFEIGSSGVHWQRNQIVESLTREKDFEVEASDFQTRPISENAILLTYKTKTENSDGSHKVALRSSIWVRNNNQWQMSFHQGTLSSEHIPPKPIGYVKSTRKEKVDDCWDEVESSINLDSSLYTPESLAGLASFSHVEVLFFMHEVPESEVSTGSRYPRGNASWGKVGIFAQRAKGRPNRIGSTICKIRSVNGLQVRIEGLDAIDGTPVLDIKPWFKEFGPRGEVKQPPWVSELMADYWEDKNG